MFTHIETLIAHAPTGSMTRAATHLRVTQSTVSKRLAVPECEVGRPLTAARCRGVRRALPELDLIVNGHRSPVAIDRVRSGEYALALVAGFS